MGICGICGKKRARFTVFIGRLQPSDNFKHVYALGDGHYINIHSKCVTQEFAYKITEIGSVAFYERDNEKRWSDITGMVSKEKKAGIVAKRWQKKNA